MVCSLTYNQTSWSVKSSGPQEKLLRTKLVEVTEFQLFQILKDDCVKELHQTCQQIWKTQQWPQDWKRKVFIPIPKKSNAKEFSGSLKKGQKLRASVTHPWRLVLMSNGITTGPRAQRQVSFKGVPLKKQNKVAMGKRNSVTERGQKQQRQQVFPTSHRATDPASPYRVHHRPT